MATKGTGLPKEGFVHNQFFETALALPSQDSFNDAAIPAGGLFQFDQA